MRNYLFVDFAIGRTVRTRMNLIGELIACSNIDMGPEQCLSDQPIDEQDTLEF